MSGSLRGVAYLHPRWELGRFIAAWKIKRRHHKIWLNVDIFELTWPVSVISLKTHGVLHIAEPGYGWSGFETRQPGD